jgi:hypothetical protein
MWKKKMSRMCLPDFDEIFFSPYVAVPIPCMKLFFQNTKKPRKKINFRPPVNPNDAMLNKTQITSHKNKYKTPPLSSLPLPHADDAF